MWTRRQFLHRTSTAAGAALATYNPDGLARILEASAAQAGRSLADIARDEDFWREVQAGFTLDRTIINLNNGGVCPSPRVVHEAFKRYLDISNQSPVYHMWQVLEPNNWPSTQNSPVFSWASALDAYVLPSAARVLPL